MNVEDLMRSNDPRDRVRAAMMDFVPTIEQVERGITDPKPYIRSIWVERADYPPTRAQVERGLSDPHGDVKKKWVLRTDWTPTDEDYINGLKSKSARLKVAWARKIPEGHVMDGIFHLSLNECASIRRAVASIPWLNDPRYVSRWLSDTDDGVRSICASKASVDIEPFISRIMSDKSAKVRKAAARRLDYTPQPSHVERGISDISPYIARRWLRRTDYVVTPDMIDRGLSHESSIVRNRWMSKAMESNCGALETEESATPSL